MDSQNQLEILGHVQGITPFDSIVRNTLDQPLTARGVEILQLNVGKRCNLQCKHCHVEAGPDHFEVMNRDVMERCLAIVKENNIGTIDITGGSPEMNPHLEWFIPVAARLGRRLMVRSNLVILLDEKYRHFLDLYADNNVEIVASLPDYLETRTDRQRGPSVFHQTLEVIQQLNQKGYGRQDSGLILDLVHNPAGAYLPGSQSALEQEYHTRLFQQHGAVFNNLFCLTNCPLGRYLEFLLRSNNIDDYMQALADAFNSTAAQKAMCTITLSVGWDGTLYDCDFNQMLELPVDHGAPRHIADFNLKNLSSRTIVVNNHCYACTAGSGSSCQGAIE